MIGFPFASFGATWLKAMGIHFPMARLESPVRIAGSPEMIPSKACRIALREHHAFAAASRASGEVRMGRRLCVVLGNELFGERRHLDISEVCKVQIGLLVFHEAEIKSSPMTLMASIRTDHREAAHECGRISRRNQAEWWQYNTISATSALHKKIAIPVVRHRQREVDSKFFAAYTSAAINDSLNPAVGRKRRTVARAVGIRFRGSSGNRCSFGDFHARTFELHQPSA